MADNVRRGTRSRYFCHRCLIQFPGISQDFVCPYCHSGFIEQMEEGAVDYQAVVGQFNDAEMSNLDEMAHYDHVLGEDTEFTVASEPILNALLLTGGAIGRPPPRHPTTTASDTSTTINSTSGTTGTTSDTTTGPTTGAATGTATGDTSGSNSSNSSTSGSNASNGGLPRRPTLMEELVWMIGGSRQPPGAMTAGAPFVLVGTQGDYVFGGEGLDAVVTQLLGQLEHSGPPPLPRDSLAAIPTQPVSPELAAALTACSVCWENFQLGETTSRLICDHVFHQTCIEPWLQLHATCPICRRSLLQSDATATAASATGSTAPTAATAATTATTATAATAAAAGPTVAEARIRLGNIEDLLTAPRVIIRRATVPAASLMRRFPTPAHNWVPGSTSAAGASPSVTSGGLWAPQRNTSTSGSNNSSSSINSNPDYQYNTDIDYD